MRNKMGNLGGIRSALKNNNYLQSALAVIAASLATNYLKRYDVYKVDVHTMPQLIKIIHFFARSSGV